MDSAGHCDFDANSMEIRRILNTELINLPAGEFKFMIFAVKKYNYDEEFKLIFEALRQEQVTGLLWYH